MTKSLNKLNVEFSFMEQIKDEENFLLRHGFQHFALEFLSESINLRNPGFSWSKQWGGAVNVMSGAGDHTLKHWLFQVSPGCSDPIPAHFSPSTDSIQMGFFFFLCINIIVCLKSTTTRLLTL